MKLTSEQLLKLKDNCNVCFINPDDLDNILMGYECFNHGSFANCYLKGNFVLKKYFQDPFLYEEDSNKVIYSYKDVVNNLIELSKINEKNSAIPVKFYVLDDELLMYKEPFMPGDRLFDIAYFDKDKEISEVKSAWHHAYYLARFYASKSITMYDLNYSNCNIHNGKLYVYDLDFFKKENDKRFILLNNYEFVNVCFIDFFEKYYFDYNYETSLTKIYKPSFCDSFFDEFFYKTHNRCKTLKEAKKYM